MDSDPIKWIGSGQTWILARLSGSKMDFDPTFRIINLIQIWFSWLQTWFCRIHQSSFSSPYTSQHSTPTVPNLQPLQFVTINPTVAPHKPHSYGWQLPYLRASTIIVTTQPFPVAIFPQIPMGTKSDHLGFSSHPKPASSTIATPKYNTDDDHGVTCPISHKINIHLWQIVNDLFLHLQVKLNFKVIWWA